MRIFLTVGLRLLNKSWWRCFIKLSVGKLLSDFKEIGIITEIIGSPEVEITGLTSVEKCGPGDLTIADKSEYVSLVETRKPAVVVTSSKLKESFSKIKGVVTLIAPNVVLAHALLKEKYADRDFSKSGWSGIHPSSVIHETAIIDSTVTIEPKVVIGSRVRIGKNTRVLAGTVIENDVVIGDDTVIHSSVVIGYGCKIGNQVIIESGTVIGSEGYGFAQDEKRKSHRIPQTGIVVIEDRVRIGAGNCIDRATYAETRIGAGTKTDNLCHIAHNVKIGEDCLLTAMLCIAGSSTVGDRVITSGQTGILDHVNVCSDTVFLHRAGVSKDIEKPGAYAGAPLQPLAEYMRNMAVLKNAVDLRKRLMEIEKHLGLTSTVQQEK